MQYVSIFASYCFLMISNNNNLIFFFNSYILSIRYIKEIDHTSFTPFHTSNIVFDLDSTLYINYLVYKPYIC